MYYCVYLCLVLSIGVNLCPFLYIDVNVCCWCPFVLFDVYFFCIVMVFLSCLLMYYCVYLCLVLSIGVNLCPLLYIDVYLCCWCPFVLFDAYLCLKSYCIIFVSMETYYCLFVFIAVYVWLCVHWCLLFRSLWQWRWCLAPLVAWRGCPAGSRRTSSSQPPSQVTGRDRHRQT